MFVTIVKILIIFGKDTNTSPMYVSFVLLAAYFPMKRINIKKRNSLRDIWDNIKYTNIHIVRVPEGEERGREVIKSNDS